VISTTTLPLAALFSSYTSIKSFSVPCLFVAKISQTVTMSEKHVGNPGSSGLDRPFVYPTPPPYVASAGFGQLASHDSNVDVQNHSLSGQVPKDPKVTLERAFGRGNLNPAAGPHQSAAGYSSLHVPKRSRSPPKEGAPPFQYRDQPRPVGYHLLSSRPIPPSSPPIATPSLQEADQSGHNVRQFNSSKPLPLLPNQGPSVKSSSNNRVAPPRPPRSPTVYDFSQYEIPSLLLAFAPSVKPSCQTPVAESSEKSPPLGATQAPTAKALFSRSPRLATPHKSGGDNPILNPFNQRAKPSPPKSSEKPSFWKRAKRKISGRRVSSLHPTRPAPPVSRFSSGSTAKAPFSRPRAPTPNRGLGISQPQADFFGQKFGESLDCETSEVALPLDKVTVIKTLFSVTDGGTVILHGDPADNWEIEALKERGILTKRVFDCPDFRFEDFGDYKAPSNENQSNIQDSAGISAPKSENLRESRDSSETLVEKPDRPRSYQDSAEILTSQIQNQRRSQDSAATLIAPRKDPVIYRDPQDCYYSLTTNRPQVAVAGGLKETSEWVEVPLSTFGKSEGSPVPSCFFEEKCSQGQDSLRLLGEVNLALSYPESLAVVETPPARVLRTPSERKRVEEYCKNLPDLHQLAPGTPKGNGYKKTYLALTGGLPTDSLCLEWRVDRHLSAGAEAGGLPHSKLEAQVDDIQSRCGAEGVEKGSPIRGRRRLRETQTFPSERCPSKESSSYTKRKLAAERRRRLAGYRPRDRGDSSERLVDKFSSARRRFDRPPSFFSVDTARAEEAGEQIAPKHTLSAARRGLERRRRLAAALDQGAASANQSFRNNDLETTKPLEQQLLRYTYKVDGQSGCAEKVDEDLEVSSNSAPPISKESVESLANPLQQFSSKVRSHSPSLLYHQNICINY
jgi:hypothetical protein